MRSFGKRNLFAFAVCLVVVVVRRPLFRKNEYTSFCANNILPLFSAYWLAELVYAFLAHLHRRLLVANARNKSLQLAALSTDDATAVTAVVAVEAPHATFAAHAGGGSIIWLPHLEVLPESAHTNRTIPLWWGAAKLGGAVRAFGGVRPVEEVLVSLGRCGLLTDDLNLLDFSYLGCKIERVGRDVVVPFFLLVLLLRLGVFLLLKTKGLLLLLKLSGAGLASFALRLASFLLGLLLLALLFFEPLLLSGFFLGKTLLFAFLSSLLLTFPALFSVALLSESLLFLCLTLGLELGINVLLLQRGPADA